MAGPAVTGRDRNGRQPRPLLRTMIGSALRRTRLAQGRTLADVSAAARVSVPYLSEIERGRKEASSEVLAAICDALQIGLSGLLGSVTDTLPEAAVVVPLSTFPARRARTGELDTPAQPGTGPQARGHGGAVCLLAA